MCYEGKFLSQELCASGSVLMEGGQCALINVTLLHTHH